MDRVNFPLTIEQLLAECDKQVKAGNGKKFVLVSDDEEGNGYHECYFTFGDAKDLAGSRCDVPRDLPLIDCVILG